MIKFELNKDRVYDIAAFNIIKSGDILDVMKIFISNEFWFNSCYITNKEDWLNYLEEGNDD